jgi:hypothetical protein
MKKTWGWENIHKGCGGNQCRLNCINNIRMHLNMYSEALSTAIFRKDNTRSKSWWLSAFYSLIIQSMVRTGLLQLTRTGASIYPTLGNHPVRRIQQYMHLGVRLFIASSGIRDPLMKDYSALPSSSQEEEQANRNYQAAQEATRRDSWGVHGIKSSADFLRTIFEDEGGPLEEPPKTTTDPPTTLLESNDDTLRKSNEYEEFDDDSHGHDNLQLPSRPLKSRENASLVFRGPETISQIFKRCATKSSSSSGK